MESVFYYHAGRIKRREIHVLGLEGGLQLLLRREGKESSTYTPLGGGGGGGVGKDSNVEVAAY